MNFRQLRYFIAVAEELHFRRAAERLNMSQPPLSQQIAALEEELGTALLHRDRRSVRLTAAGEAFLRRARGILEQASQAETETRRIGRGEVGRLVISFMSAAMLNRLPPVLKRFRGANVDVVVDLLQLPPKEQLEAVAAGRVDIGFLTIEPSAPPLRAGDGRLAAERVWEEELVAALPADHRLAGRKSLPLRALDSETFITLPRTPETGHHDQVMEYCARDGGFRAAVGREVEQLPVALALIAAGAGVSLVPVCAAVGWQGLVAFPRLDERPAIPVAAVWRADSPSPVLARFRDVLRDDARPSHFAAGAD